MPNQIESPSEAYNIKEFIFSALAYKYYYIASFVVFMAIAFMLNKFSPVVVRVSSIIGPIENKGPSLRGSAALFNGVADYSQVRNIDNDINSLSSFSLVSTTIKDMNLEVGYYTDKSNIFGHPHQIYKGSAYTVNIDKSHLQPINARFFIKIIDDKSYRLRCSEKEATLYNYVDNYIESYKNSVKIDTICKFNETIRNKYFRFSVSRNKEDYFPDPRTENLYYFEFYHQDLLAQQYLRKLKVEPVDTKSSLIKVSFQGENMGLTVDFLNNYLQAYLNEDLSKKNKIALSTRNFIDSQISGISDSLSKSESRLKDYRSSNQVTNLSYQGQQALEQMTRIETEKSTLLVQERYYKYILDYFDKNKDVAGLAPPSSANVVDPLMTTLVTELLSLNAQKASIQGNLFLAQIESKIKTQKQAIIENVTNSLNTLTLTQNELNYRAEKLSGEISKLPRTELNMVSMQRKFNLSDAIYTFLLQKRAESEITMASNIPDYEIMDPARETSKVILSPKTMYNWLLAIFLAFMGPTVYIILKNYFNEKVNSVSDVQRLIDRHIFGTIYSNLYGTETVVADFPGSSIAESFRNLRSSLFLRLRNEPSKVVLVTSAQPRDGKSFVAFNLASSIAAVGYKTIILDCDLRRPTLHLKFNEDNSTGLSVYMDKKATLDEIIINTSIPNLSFIPAGPQLPNPSELMESGILDDLILDLKSKYDYIILDTTPAGIVADAFLMMKHASQILVVCRNNYTRKDIFSEVINNLQTNKFANYDVVFNDLDLKRSQYGAYNSYYHKE